MNKRINITLPQGTLQLLDRVAAKGERSHLIDQAIKHYVRDRSRAQLRKQLAAGARRNAQSDLLLVEEWSDLDEETWGASNRS